MRRAWILAIGFGLLAAGGTPAAGPILKTKKDRLSYAMAVAVARSVQRQGMEIDAGIFALGLNDAFAGGPLQMTPAEMRESMGAVLAELKERQARAAGAEGARKR